MPWTLKNPPSVAKNWTDAEKKKCVKAANAVLEADGSEQAAIFACIHAAGRSNMGRGLQLNEAFSQLVEEVYSRDEFAFINDLYIEDTGAISAIISSRGKLYRASMQVIDGAAQLTCWNEVEVMYQPHVRGFTVTRQADGTYRWFAIAETAVLLRVGEIDSKDLFDDFIANVEEFGYPTLRFYHDDRMDFGQADWLAREENCLLASGTFYDHPLSNAMIESNANWGTSVGFTATEEPELWHVAEGVTIPVNRRGILREISVLPEHKAASWFTSIATEVTRMRPEVSEALVNLFGDEEKAREYIEIVDATNREIYENALITREDITEEEPALEVPDTTEESVEDDAPTIEYVSKEELEAALETVRESLPTVDLAPIEERLATLLEEKFAALQERIEALEKPVEEHMRELIDDMPSRTEYRPREVNAQEAKRTFDSVASATLAAIEH